MSETLAADTLVSLEILPLADGRCFGVATLNAPASLNALSLPMIDLLDPALKAWQRDPQVVGVLIRGTGDQAFCAGGDVVRLTQAAQAWREAGKEGVAPSVKGFFEREYRMDHRLHTFGKPVLVWGNGIVMGGGVGLLMGASHRVVTPQTRLAMPELGIGLFPDVGGSWFLNRLPGGLGRFLALTGAHLNTADVLHVGMADFVLPHAAWEALLEDLQATEWNENPKAHATQLSQVLGVHAADLTQLPTSNVACHRARIDAVIGHDDLPTLAPRLSALALDADPWLARAGRNFANGSPTSAALALALQVRARHLALADVFRLEYNAACGCAAHADFIEGVRALLVDKDKSPRWTPATLNDVSSTWIDSHLWPRYIGKHPLADLG